MVQEIKPLDKGELQRSIDRIIEAPKTGDVDLQVSKANTGTIEVKRTAPLKPEPGLY